jgi:hypothetical protein
MTRRPVAAQADSRRRSTSLSRPGSNSHGACGSTGGGYWSIAEQV